MRKQVAIWLDHREARVLHVPPTQLDEAILPAQLHKIHHRRGAKKLLNEHARPTHVKRFFRKIERSLKGAKQILLVGPSTSKLDFARYLRKHDHGLERRIVGIETVLEPTDKQLTAFTNEYFPTRKTA